MWLLLTVGITSTTTRPPRHHLKPSTFQNLDVCPPLVTRLEPPFFVCAETICLRWRSRATAARVVCEEEAGWLVKKQEFLEGWFDVWWFSCAMDKPSCCGRAWGHRRDSDGEGDSVSFMTKMSSIETGPASDEPSNGSTRSRPTSTYIRGRWKGFPGTLLWTILLMTSLCAVPTSAVFIDFQNCLSDGYQKNTPTQLQFVPLFLSAVFNTSNADHNLNVTVWGNVTGSGPTHLVQIPSWNNTAYWEGNQTNLGGKILDNPEPDAEDPKLTTLFNKVNVLTYEPWSESVSFCGGLGGGYECPLGPNFTANA